MLFKIKLVGCSRLVYYSSASLRIPLFKFHTTQSQYVNFPIIHKLIFKKQSKLISGKTICLYQPNFNTPNNGFCIIPIDNQSQRMRVMKLSSILITNRYYCIKLKRFIISFSMLAEANRKFNSEWQFWLTKIRVNSSPDLIRGPDARDCLVEQYKYLKLKQSCYFIMRLLPAFAFAKHSQWRSTENDKTPILISPQRENST